MAYPLPFSDAQKRPGKAQLEILKPAILRGCTNYLNRYIVFSYKNLITAKTNCEIWEIILI
jgi:hypothetical protein